MPSLKMFTSSLRALGRRRRSAGRRESVARGRQRRRTPQTWRQVVRGRLGVAGLCFAVWMLGIESRLVYLQVISHDKLSTRAKNQQSRSIEAHSKRGEILDRNGRVLAYSVDGDAVYAVPYDIDDAAATVARLCAVMECSSDKQADLESRLGGPGQFEYVLRQAPLDVARRIAALDLPGIGFLPENRRYYPNGELAAHALGYVGLDNQGLAGIESKFDAQIAGRLVKMLVQVDSRGRAFSRLEGSPVTGATIELTIDTFLQHIAERELEAGVREHRADGGTLVVLDPYSGEVLAMANWPTFNPNVLTDFDETARRNRAVQDLYEPGSTFKIVAASAALEEHVFTREKMFDVTSGKIRVGRKVHRDMSTSNRPLSFDDVIVKSSNVGAIQIGLELGPERWLRYIRRFGFGAALAPDFAGQQRGHVPSFESLSKDGVRATVSMGYGVSVTALQMATAVSAIASRGLLVEPRLVRAVIRNGIRAEIPSRTVRRAVSEATAANLTEIMEGVVQRGTARRAQVPGYRVAGKTGTAEKLVGGVYSHSDHYASFVGFVPARGPELTVLVVIDTPRGARNTGGAVAAPIFSRFAAAALRYRAVPATVDPPPPVFVHPQVDQPRTALVSAVRSAVRDEAPIEASQVRDDGLMPDVRGMSARQASKILTLLGMEVQFEGAGFVSRHDPSPGGAIERGSTVTLHMRRRGGSLEVRR